MTNASLLCEQGSREWKQARCGMITASRCGDVIAYLKKGGERAERRSYREELIVETLTGVPAEQYLTREMQWGVEQEPFARAAYELDQNVLVETTGFLVHPKIQRFGASPDGLVGKEGLIQIKCPTTANHLKTILAGSIPLEHMPQILAELSVTGRAWCDYVSFDPRLPEHLQLFIRRYERDEEILDRMEQEIVDFRAEIDEVLRQLPQAPEGKPQPVVNLLDYVAKDEVIQ